MLIFIPRLNMPIEKATKKMLSLIFSRETNYEKYFITNEQIISVPGKVPGVAGAPRRDQIRTGVSAAGVGHRLGKPLWTIHQQR